MKTAAALCFLFLAAILSARSDIVQVNVSGNLFLEGPFGEPLAAGDYDYFDSSISTTGPNPYTFSFTYDTTAQPTSPSVYPGLTGSVSVGDYHESGLSIQLNYLISPGATITGSSFYVPPVYHASPTLQLYASRGSYFNGENFNNSTVSTSLSSFSVAMDSYSDGLYGRVSSVSSTVLAAPEPSSGMLLLLASLALAFFHAAARWFAAR